MQDDAQAYLDGKEALGVTPECWERLSNSEKDQIRRFLIAHSDANNLNDASQISGSTFQFIPRELWAKVRPFLDYFSSGPRFFLSSAAVVIAFAFVVTPSIERSLPATVLENEHVDLNILVVAFWASVVGIIWVWRSLSIASKAGREAIGSLRIGEDSSNESLSNRVTNEFGGGLWESILQYEKLCRTEYENDLRRHLTSYGFVIFSSVAVVCVALNLIWRVSAIAEQSQWSVGLVTAAGTILPAVVEACALKIWMETRKNLSDTRDAVDQILRYKLRFALILGNEEPKFELDRDVTAAIEILKVIQGDFTGRPTSPIKTPKAEDKSPSSK
ncbi:MAG: hypothetical protein AAF251_08050 [Pseudomonadota bacterium]